MKRSTPFILLLLLLCHSSFETEAQAQDAFWQKLDGPSGAVITSFVETEQGFLLAGTMSGLLQSENAGRSWVDVTDELDQLEVWALEQTGAGGLYAATTDGIYKSADDGQSWLEMDAVGMFERTADIALASGNRLFVTTDQGVFLTEDEGLSWERRHAGIPEALSVQNLAIAANDVVIAATASGGIYKTTDFGVSWVAANVGIDDPFIRSLYADTAGNLWAGTGSGNVYRSTDAGDSWSATGNGLAGLDIRALTETPEGMVAGASTGNEEGVVGGIYWFNSTNAVWEKRDIFSRSAEIRSMYALKNGELIAGTSGRSVYRSENGGNNWLPYEMGISNTNVWGIYPTHQGRVYVSSYKAGFNRSSDNGLSWESLTFSPNQESLHDFTAGPNGALYVATDQFNVYRSLDDGFTWDLVAEDLLTHHIGTTAAGTVLLGGYGKVYRSTDAGDSWDTIRLPTVSNGHALFTDVLEFEQAPDGVIYTAVQDYGVFTSRDDGQTWVMARNEGLEDLNINRLVRTTQGKLLLSFLRSHERYAGIMVSEDEGDTWTSLAALPVPEVITIPDFTTATITEDLYVVFNQVDNKGEWIPHGYRYVMASGVWEALPFVSNELGYFAFDASGYLYSGTHGDGIYRSKEVMAKPFSAVSTEEVAAGPDDGFALAPNFPNPFATRTNIRYSLPEATPVSVVVFDVLGREVQTFEQGMQPAGIHDLSFDATNLPNGMYYFQLDTPGRRITRSMIVMK